MGCIISTQTEETEETPTTETTDVDIDDLANSAALIEEKEKEAIFTRDKTKNFMTSHSKQYERYFNRQFKVSVCSAQGERRKMEDDHLCDFVLSNHPNYSIFGVFDGHNGSNASSYLAEHLYKILNNLPDLEDNQQIISSIKEMDKQYLSTSDDNKAGSTIVFVIIGSDFDSVVKLNTQRSINSTKTIRDSDYQPPTFSEVAPKKQHKFAFGASGMLAGFEINYSARVFWCGDSRGYLVHTSTENQTEYDVLTHDHNTKNEMEIKRIEKMNGKIINGRVDGKLAVTRSFGDSRMKYDGSVIIPECECNEFDVNVGDSLLLCCDGLVETWSDKILIERLVQYINAADKHNTDTDTVKVIGNLVDDAIYEGSNDNISAMLIEFKDGTKHKTNAKYQNV